METNCVHHIELGVQNGMEHVQKFLSLYNFRLAATRTTAASKQWLLTSNDVRFVITQLTGDLAVVKADPYLQSWAFPTGHDAHLPKFDSVFNVALRVGNIEACVERLTSQGAQMIKPLKSLADSNGSVRVCMVKSCVGNIVHTLVDDSDYCGLFLPGFQAQHADEKDCGDQTGEDSSINRKTPADSDLQYVDHVNLCIRRAASASVVGWYERCFGMKRFFANSVETEDDGFLIVRAMRMRALEYWKCAETGLSTEGGPLGSFKIVIAESLPSQEVNQVDVFLDRHGGEGVQHIALHTGDIIEAVSKMQDNGVVFNDVPDTYYSEVGRLREMQALGVNVDLLQKYKILLDVEEDASTIGQRKELHSGTDPQTSGDARYLMQTFARPFFEADTSFLEVIQRVGATGFGAGNITALWRSFQAYLEEKGFRPVEINAEEA